MNAQEFVNEWIHKKDTDDTNAVGIAINWNAIPFDSKVLQFYGSSAWEKIETFYTPVWGNFSRTKLSGWLNPNRTDYKKFIDEEQLKIEFYKNYGLPIGYREFCAFADDSGNIGVLGDGSHRFIDCNYLILQGTDLGSEIALCRLDVICIKDLSKILSIQDMPPGLI